MMTEKRLDMVIVFVFALSGFSGCSDWFGGSKKNPPPARPPEIGGVNIFSADNAWNQDISNLPIRSDSDAIISVIGKYTAIHFDFGNSSIYGIPYTIVDSSQTMVPITITTYSDESDPGPMPIPLNAPVEGDGGTTGDRHVLVLNPDTALLYELFAAEQVGGGWTCAGAAVWDLTDNNKRLAGYSWESGTVKGAIIDWSSADAAGLPIFPGLVKYEEVAAGEIRHAFRMTISSSSPGYIYPASHQAPTYPSAGHAVMGMRFRLKASFDISPYSPDAQVILRAMKTYGLIVADNGSNWYISGTSDSRWNMDDLTVMYGGTLAVRGDDFECVDTGVIRHPGD